MRQRSNHAELMYCLREAKVLSPDALDRLEARSSQSIMPIGVILRQRGKLTMAQLVELAHMKSTGPGTRLGELAVQKGWCTMRDVEEALVEQERRVHVLDMVLAEASCDGAALTSALVRYARVLEERMATIESTTS
jgi:hypothetical protein